MSYLIIEGDFFIGNDEYWQYKCQVQIRGNEVFDTEIISAKGAGPDDTALEINELIEDHIKELAETRAREQINDPFVTVSFEREDE